MELMTFGLASVFSHAFGATVHIFGIRCRFDPCNHVADDRKGAVGKMDPWPKASKLRAESLDFTRGSSASSPGAVGPGQSCR